MRCAAVELLVEDMGLKWGGREGSKLGLPYAAAGWVGKQKPLLLRTLSQHSAPHTPPAPARLVPAQTWRTLLITGAEGGT